MLLRNERFSPSMAVPMSVTVTMPITMPSVVSTERILLARIAPHEMPKPSRISANRFMAGLTVGSAFVTGDQTVADADDAAGVSGHVFFVRHHDDGVALLRELLE